MCEFTERIFSEGKAEGRAEGEISANYAAAKRMLLKGNTAFCLHSLLSPTQQKGGAVRRLKG